MKRADQTLNAHYGYFLMTSLGEGFWKGKSYKEKATALQFDHLRLILPELKGHAAPTQRDRLIELERSWVKAMGRR